MKYRDIKKIYTSFGGTHTDSVDGRTSVSKLYDLSENKDHQSFPTGNRPELHKTLDEKHQVCVEKESTNLFSYSEHIDLNNTGWRDSEATVDPNYGTFLGTKVSRIVVEGGNSWRGVRYDSDGNLPVNALAETPFVFSCWIKNVSNFQSLQVSLRDDSSSHNFSDIIDLPQGEWRYVSLRTFLNNDSATARFYIRNVDLLDAEYHITQLQIEEGEYATNWIPTQEPPVTRLAPSPVIENALPDSGTIGGVYDSIKNGNGRTTLWTSVGSEGQSNFLTFEENNTLRWGNFGNLMTIDTDIDWVWSENERGTFAWAITHNSIASELWILHGTTLYIYTGNVGGFKLDRNVEIGQSSGQSQNPPTSIRTEVVWYKDHIVRVEHTDDEKINFFKKLTTGTNIPIIDEDSITVVHSGEVIDDPTELVGTMGGGGTLNGIIESPEIPPTELTGTITGGGVLNGIIESPEIPPTELTGTITGGGELNGIIEVPDIPPTELIGTISGGGSLVGIIENPDIPTTELVGTMSGGGTLNGIISTIEGEETEFSETWEFETE